MTDGGGFKADPGLLESLASKLRSGGQALTSLAGSVPDMPDAGDMSSQMAATLAHQIESAAELATGVSASAAAVGQSAQSYEETENSTRQSLSSEH